MMQTCELKKVVRGLYVFCWVITLFLLISYSAEICNAQEKKLEGGKGFPSKPITILLPAGAGGSMGKDIRAFLPFFEKHLGVGTSVEYVTGAEGIIGYNKFYKEKADGYTIMYLNLASAITLELTREAAKYVIKDLVPIAAWNMKSLVLLVHPDASKNFSEFVNDARQKEVNVSYMGGSAGLQCILLETVLGLKLNMIPYKSGGESIAAAAGKHVEATITFTNVPKQLIEAGKLRALSIFSTKQDPFLTSVPTIKELGYPEVPLLIVYGIFAAPPNTPRVIVDILERAVRAAVAEPEFKKLADTVGIALDFAPSSEVTGLIQNDYALLNKYKELIK